MKKALRGLATMGQPLSPDQFDSVMAQFAGTQPMGRQSTQPPKRSPGRLEKKPS